MLVRIQHGLDLPLDGEPEPRIENAARVRSVALFGRDYNHLRPSLQVAEGEHVELGQTLFTSGTNQTIRFTAPGTGRVRAIQRGARRRLEAIVIDLDNADTGSKQTDLPTLTPGAIDGAAAAHVKRALLASGLWTSLRARPYGAVADPEQSPRAIFVNAMKTGPLAPEPAAALVGESAHLENGLAGLRTLRAETFLCKAPTLELDRERVGATTVVDFSGPYPAGLSGTHINLLAAVGEQPDVWHISYADVVAIGKLLTTGVLDMTRVVAIGGPCARRPRLVRTRIGANLDELLLGEAEAGARVVSGSPLSGRSVTAAAPYLGRYDHQISLLREHAGPAHTKPGHGSTAMHGWPSGMLCLEIFEHAWPFEVPPIPLLRALLAQDLEMARALGCLGFEEEDLALLSYLCPAKYDYGRALRTALDALHAEA